MVFVMIVMVVTTEGRGVACLYYKDPNKSACICVKVGVLLEPIGFLGCVLRDRHGISLVSKPVESRQVG